MMPCGAEMMGMGDADGRHASFPRRFYSFLEAEFDGREGEPDMAVHIDHARTCAVDRGLGEAVDFSAFGLFRIGRDTGDAVRGNAIRLGPDKGFRYDFRRVRSDLAVLESFRDQGLQRVERNLHGAFSGEVRPREPGRARTCDGPPFLSTRPYRHAGRSGLATDSILVLAWLWLAASPVWSTLSLPPCANPRRP